jgi:copper chaperone CopZ
MKTTNLKVRGLECPHCAEEMEKVLLARRGVRTAAVRPGDPAGAEVEYDERTVTPEQLVAVLRKEGYDARIGGHSAGGHP